MFEITEFIAKIVSMRYLAFIVCLALGIGSYFLFYSPPLPERPPLTCHPGSTLTEIRSGKNFIFKCVPTNQWEFVK